MPKRLHPLNCVSLDRKGLFYFHVETCRTVISAILLLCGLVTCPPVRGVYFRQKYTHYGIFILKMGSFRRNACIIVGHYSTLHIYICVANLCTPALLYYTIDILLMVLYYWYTRIAAQSKKSAVWKIPCRKEAMYIGHSVHYLLWCQHAWIDSEDEVHRCQSNTTWIWY